ncbi:MAG: hypothetical protein MUC67_04325 [Acidobacteria bacterium]|jgi:hypothetical protein|nr:hypothetical protein [Acidobacteriota bacterium]
MSGEESTLPCALVEGREAAEWVVSRLSEAGIPATLHEPGERYHAIGPSRFEVRVPATQVARARVLLG